MDTIKQHAHLSLHEFVARIGLKHPALQVLELASGQDAVTRVALGALELRDGERLCSAYTYACMSAESISYTRCQAAMGRRTKLQRVRSA